MLLIAILTFVPFRTHADGASHPVAKTKLAPGRFEIHPTGKFKNGDTADRLVGMLSGANVRIAETGRVIQIDTADVRSKDVMTHAGVTDILRIARENGFEIHAAPGAHGDLSALKQELKPFGADHLVITPK